MGTGGITMPNKEQILKTSMAFMESKLVLSSVELGLYDLLHGIQLTAEQVAERLELNPSKVFDFLDSLLSMSYLERIGNGREGLYSNSQSSDKYLVSSSEHYIGGMLIMSSRRLYKYWHHLPEALRTGEAQSEVKDS